MQILPELDLQEERVMMPCDKFLLLLNASPGTCTAYALFATIP